jgi:hypothetical protein
MIIAEAGFGAGKNASKNIVAGKSQRSIAALSIGCSSVRVRNTVQAARKPRRAPSVTIRDVDIVRRDWSDYLTSGKWITAIKIASRQATAQSTSHPAFINLKSNLWVVRACQKLCSHADASAIGMSGPSALRQLTTTFGSDIARVQGVEVGDAIDAEHDGFAVDGMEPGSRTVGCSPCPETFDTNDGGIHA